MWLKQIASETITSSTAYVDLIGTTTDDVYMIVVNGYIPTSDAADLRARVLESSTPNETANYDRAFISIRTDTTYSDASNTNETYYDLTTAVGTSTGEQMNGIIYLYSANDSNEFTYLTAENAQLSHSALLIGNQGSAVFTSNSQVNGLRFFPNTGNIASGTFTLYQIED